MTTFCARNLSLSISAAVAELPLFVCIFLTHVFGQRDSSTIPELIFENHIFSGCGHILKQSWLTLLA
jgi:hypothetical protein